MHLRTFIICDMEKEYARNLMKVISSKKELRFQVQAFHDIEKVKEFSKEKQIQILLVGEEFPEEDRTKIDAQETYVLVSDAARTFETEEKCIFKYQSSDAILAEINAEMKTEKISSVEPHEGKLIGIYSPVHRIGKTKFALELGKQSCSEQPVLYLNLEDYSGQDQYFPDAGRNNLGDLLYFMRQEHVDLGFRISAMTGQKNGVDYIAPIPVIQDLKKVKEKEWEELFKKIFSDTIYKTIILDLGEMVDGLYEILSQCETVYTLSGDDPISQAKIRQYTENLHLLGFSDVLEHTVLKTVHIKDGGR